MEKRKASITKKKLKTLQQQLKNLNMQWVPLLIDQMRGDKEIDKVFRKVNEKKVYNVFNSIIKNTAWKVAIYRQATLLKEKLEKELAEVA